MNIRLEIIKIFGYFIIKIIVFYIYDVFPLV